MYMQSSYCVISSQKKWPTNQQNISSSTNKTHCPPKNLFSTCFLWFWRHFSRSFYPSQPTYFARMFVLTARQMADGGWRLFESEMLVFVVAGWGSNEIAAELLERASRAGHHLQTSASRRPHQDPLGKISTTLSTWTWFPVLLLLSMY